jgi:hypothetical protein
VRLHEYQLPTILFFAPTLHARTHTAALSPQGAKDITPHYAHQEHVFQAVPIRRMTQALASHHLEEGEGNTKKETPMHTHAHTRTHTREEGLIWQMEASNRVVFLFCGFLAALSFSLVGETAMLVGHPYATPEVSVVTDCGVACVVECSECSAVYCSVIWHTPTLLLPSTHERECVCLFDVLIMLPHTHARPQVPTYGTSWTHSQARRASSTQPLLIWYACALHCTHMCLNTHTRTYINVYVSVCIYLWVCVCVCVCATGLRHPGQHQRHPRWLVHGFLCMLRGHRQPQVHIHAYTYTTL